MKNILTLTALVLFGLIVSLGAVELLLRAGVIKSSRYYDQVSRMIPAGYHGSGRFKMILLGDSFLANRKIQKLLLEHLDSDKIEGMTLARKGAGPNEYLDYLITYGAAYSPNMILLGYYVGNDLTNVQYELNNKKDEKKYLMKKLEIANDLYLYHFLKERLRLMGWYRRAEYEQARDRGVDEAILEKVKKNEINYWLLPLSNKHPKYLIDNILMEGNENMKAWELIKDMILQIREISRQIQAELFIVIFPRSVQVNASHVEFWKGLGFDFDQRLLSSRKPQELMISFCAENDIKCLDLLPHFKAENEELYLKDDDHLNGKGNTVSANLIAQALEQYLFLK